MTYLTLYSEQTAERRSTMYVEAIATAYTAGASARQRAPFFVPRDQDYFWTDEWQRGETEALREIAEGDVRRFTSGMDAIRWLLSDDDNS